MVYFIKAFSLKASIILETVTNVSLKNIYPHQLKLIHCFFCLKGNTISLVLLFTLVNIISSIQPNIKNSAAIGIFDSGVGGLSITKYIAEHLPNENIIYVADTLHAPYGDKPVDFIIERVNLIAQKLINRGVKAIVIACNTATVNAIEQLRAQVNIPIIGVEPAIKPAAKQSKTKKVAILATQATSDNHRFKDLIVKHQNGTQVLIQPCPGLVEFIEQGEQESPACTLLLTNYLQPLIKQGIDTLVLGCTHYPFVQKQITNITGPQVKIIETAAPVTLQLEKKLNHENISACGTQKAKYEFYSSKANEQQAHVFTHLWQSPLELLQLD